MCLVPCRPFSSFARVPKLTSMPADCQSLARELAEKTDNPEVKALAELIVMLADECERTDRKAQDASRLNQSRRK